MLPLAKAAVLAVLLGGGVVGTYALTGGFGSGSGNGNTETAQEGTTESNTVPAPADAAQVVPRDSEVNLDVGGGAGEPVANATQQLSSRDQEPQKDSGATASGPKPAEGERTQDTPVVQNTVSGENTGTNEVSSVSGQTPEVGGDQNDPEKDTANSGGATASRGEEAEVTLGEEKTGLPNGVDGSERAA